MFCRLIPPSWLKEQGARVEEGIFKADYIEKKNKEGFGAYWFPNHPDARDFNYSKEKKYLSGKDISVFDYVFVDMDLKDGNWTKPDFIKEIVNFDLRPSMVVDSGNGVHAYWKVKGLARKDYTNLQMKLLRHFKTDESVWTVLQLMRIPGSINTKDQSNFKEAEIVYESDESHRLLDFNMLPILSDSDANKCDNHVRKLNGEINVHLTNDVNLDEIPDSFVDLMIANPMLHELFNNPESYGDRSAADMKLINQLYNKDISKKDALCVAANTQKALDKGLHRYDYAQMTVDKAYIDRTKNHFQTVDQMLKGGMKKVEREFVNGPSFFDCLENRWSKKQVLGLVAGSGVGKTAVTLKIFKDMIDNNIDNDDLFVFFSLEMPVEEIIERWQFLGGDGSRLIVIGNEDENNEPRNIGMQEIYEYCTDIKKSSGRDIGAIAIDHVGIISHHIDTRKKHTFGVDNDMDSGWGDHRKISLNNLCTQMKTMAKMLNTFLILLTQTTKEKGIGYKPIEKDAAYGVSQYENIVDYMVGLWQPVMLVQNDCEVKFLSWQYCKIRNKHKKDPMSTNQFKLLTYDMSTGDLNIPSDAEYDVFKEMMPMQVEAMKAKEKSQETTYTKSIDIKELDMIANKLRGKE